MGNRLPRARTEATTTTPGAEECRSKTNPPQARVCMIIHTSIYVVHSRNRLHCQDIDSRSIYYNTIIIWSTAFGTIHIIKYTEWFANRAHPDFLLRYFALLEFYVLLTECPVKSHKGSVPQIRTHPL